MDGCRPGWVQMPAPLWLLDLGGSLGPRRRLPHAAWSVLAVRVQGGGRYSSE